MKLAILSPTLLTKFIEDPAGVAPVVSVWGFIDGEPSDLSAWVTAARRKPRAWWRPALISPADPTIAAGPPPQNDYSTPTSFSGNMFAFEGKPQLPAGFPDGTSSTIAYAERYAFMPPVKHREQSHWPYYDLFGGPKFSGTNAATLNHHRRATFADRRQDDVVPLTSGNPPASVPSEPGVTFLAQPAFRDDYVGVLQSPYPTGLQVAFFDGSVRFLRVGISEPTFWGMVTRDGGEVISE